MAGKKSTTKKATKRKGSRTPAAKPRTRDPRPTTRDPEVKTRGAAPEKPVSDEMPPLRAVPEPVIKCPWCEYTVSTNDNGTHPDIPNGKMRTYRRCRRSSCRAKREHRFGRFVSVRDMTAEEAKRYDLG